MSWESQEWLESADDEIREDVLRAMERLRQEQGEGFGEIFELIGRADPEGFVAMGGANEYNMEAQAIYARLAEARSPQGVRRIVEEEFQRAFGVAYGASGAVRVIANYRVKMPEADLDALAAAIWRTWVNQSLADR